MSISDTDAKKGLINDQMESQLESLSAQVEANLERGRNAWAEWRQTLADSTSRFADRASECAHERPWQMIAGAAALGLLIGLTCSRTRHTRAADFI